jgi:hypothetical protein
VAEEAARLGSTGKAKDSEDAIKLLDNFEASVDYFRRKEEKARKPK